MSVILNPIEIFPAGKTTERVKATVRNPKKRSTSKRKAKDMAKRKRRTVSAATRRKISRSSRRAKNGRRRSLSAAHRRAISRGVKAAKARRRRTYSNPVVRVGNPSVPRLGNLLNLAGGYLGSMVLGSTVTENLVPNLPQPVKVLIRGAIGSAVSFLSERSGYGDSDRILEGAILYTVSELVRGKLRGKTLPVVKTGLENVGVAALPAASQSEGETSGFVFSKPVPGGNVTRGFVPAMKPPLNVVATPAGRGRSRFTAGQPRMPLTSRFASRA